MENKTILILLGILSILTLSISGCLETGKGTAVDTVYDVGLDGLVWKTYVVYLTNDHPSAGKTGSDYSAIYTVDKDNTEVIRRLEEARDNGRKVKIYYTNNMVYLPWEHHSNAVGLIYKVEYIITN